MSLGIQSLLWLATTSGCIFLASAAIIYFTTALYRLTLHPLAHFPGPKLAACSQLWIVHYYASGRLPYKLQALHKEYGDIVRTGPNELIFMNAEAFRVIYGRPSSGRPPFPKVALYHDRRSTHSNIVTVRDLEEHSKLRKQYSPAFQLNALADNEIVVLKNVDSFAKS
ncbi:hypothetical protein X797_011957 [Metarhizium robertsii]|uniref:Cytochrome P450 n=2 Tax=Metarhizium robertsii TaxID=568076 RepID=E9FDK4_METRA|nr:uncharacterized protein MAA_10353 [Metarhizium robertsii ARSEF 23]EFY94182.1 hypothetical protein MAA_10353 [Metarhizium robertsii ARSEF 23]EXU94958.1 hypothetical protein X797_011957 [Metarhizium robertsii]